jgi:hypothetical protein
MWHLLPAPTTRASISFGATLIADTMGTAVAPKAEEAGHHHHHDSHYRHWKQPSTDISCCSDHDCAPVQAELRQGRWFALRESEWFAVPDEEGPGQWLTLPKGDWIAVPDNKIIRESNPTVEGAHLCYSAGIVVCFLPPSTGG